MGRNKKDAAQDVLTLYNQMQEDETIERGKEEIRTTLDEIVSAKEALSSVIKELTEANRTMRLTKTALMAVQRVRRISLTESAMLLSRQNKATSKLASMMKDLHS